MFPGLLTKPAGLQNAEIRLRRVYVDEETRVPGVADTPRGLALDASHPLPEDGPRCLARLRRRRVVVDLVPRRGVRDEHVRVSGRRRADALARVQRRVDCTKLCLII